jgi:hypothetical protein
VSMYYCATVCISLWLMDLTYKQCHIWPASIN